MKYAKMNSEESAREAVESEAAITAAVNTGLPIFAALKLERSEASL
ncbi:MAG: hypothetical protein LKJ90_09480 [Faecalibacterium sp.]|nr:hypothetical protein [Faecalibacterium sp.]